MRPCPYIFFLASGLPFSFVLRGVVVPPKSGEKERFWNFWWPPLTTQIMGATADYSSRSLVSWAADSQTQVVPCLIWAAVHVCLCFSCMPFLEAQEGHQALSFAAAALEAEERSLWSAHRQKTTATLQVRNGPALQQHLCSLDSYVTADRQLRRCSCS